MHRLNFKTVEINQTMDRIEWKFSEYFFEEHDFQCQIIRYLYFSFTFRTSNHLFPIGSTNPMTEEIDVDRLMSYFDSVLNRTEMRSKDSVIVFNVGIHLARATQLRSAFAIIDAYISRGKQYNANIIWRGQNAFRESPRLNFFRNFITNPVSNILEIFTEVLELHTSKMKVTLQSAIILGENLSHEHNLGQKPSPGNVYWDTN